MIFPDRTFTWLTVFRAFVVWLALRIVSLAAGVGLVVDLYASVLIIVVTVALVTLDGRRRNEHLFLANLGVSLTALLILAGLPPAVMELAIGIAALPW